MVDLKPSASGGFAPVVAVISGGIPDITGRHLRLTMVLGEAQMRGTRPLFGSSRSPLQVQTTAGRRQAVKRFLSGKIDK